MCGVDEYSGRDQWTYLNRVRDLCVVIVLGFTTKYADHNNHVGSFTTIISLCSCTFHPLHQLSCSLNIEHLSGVLPSCLLGAHRNVCGLLLVRGCADAKFATVHHQLFARTSCCCVGVLLLLGFPLDTTIATACNSSLRPNPSVLAVVVRVA